MNAFNRLSSMQKVVVVASALFLLSFSLSILVFGENFVTHDHHLMEQVQESVKADMLYSNPEAHF